jgi:hypothetical protein
MAKAVSSGRNTPSADNVNFKSDCVNIYIITDDKQKRENQTGSPFEAKQVDDKFKEILQKRKGEIFV